MASRGRIGRRHRLFDRWIVGAVAIAAVQLGLTIRWPGQAWSIPAGIAALALLCAARTFVDAPRGGADAGGWRWTAAGAGMAALGLQWIAKAFLNGALAGDLSLPSMMSVVARAAIVVSLIPLTPVEDRPLLRGLDAAQGVIFALMLALLSWPELLLGASEAPDRRYLYLGYGAMAALALAAFFIERSDAVRRLIVAMLAAQLGYGGLGVVSTELFVRGLVTLDMPLLALPDLAFLAYLLLIGRPAAPSRERADRWDGAILPPRLVPILLVSLIVALAFAMVPLTGGIAAAAALASLAVHAVRAWLTEDRFRRHQREVLGAAQGRIDNLADLMHEVRSPLGLISLNAGLIGRGVIDGAKAAALSETIQSRCRSIAAMLDDTLDLERIEAGLMPVHRRPCDLRTLVAAELDGVRVQAREYGIELTGPAATRTADVDPAALARILANLLNNALRFTPAGGRVGVSIEEGGAGGTIVAVRDTGTGIPAETRADLFRRFAVPGVPLNGRRGSGLGLSISISMALARSMGGELALGDTGEGGTRIEIRLPGARSGRG